MDTNYSVAYVELCSSHWWWKSRKQVVLRELRRCLQNTTKPLRILDIGCANGYLFDDLSKYGEVYGLEPDAQLIAHAGKWTDRITCSQLHTDFRPEQPFDVILMLDVLEHLEDDLGALQHLHSLLQDGGTLLLTVPALPSLWSAHDTVNHHFRRYTHRSLAEQLEAAEFEITRLRSLFRWSLPLLYLRKWLAPPNQADYQVRVPHAFINYSFESLTWFEEATFSAIHWQPPTGSSLIAVARRGSERVFTHAKEQESQMQN